MEAPAAAGAILILFGLAGDLVLSLFDVGLPAFQMAGGLIFLIYACNSSAWCHEHQDQSGGGG